MFILTTGQLHAASLVSFAILAYTAAEFNGNNGAAKPRDSSGKNVLFSTNISAIYTLWRFLNWGKQGVVLDVDSC